MKKIAKVLLLLSIIVLIAAGCSERLLGTPRDGTTTNTYDKAKQQIDQANEKEKQQQELPDEQNNGTATPEKKNLTVKQAVQGSNLNKPSYQVAEGITAMELLKTNHQVETKVFAGAGEFVNSIDGIKPDSKHFWAFYVNGQLSNVGADQYQLKDGDKIEWRLETINSYSN